MAIRSTVKIAVAWSGPQTRLTAIDARRTFTLCEGQAMAMRRYSGFNGGTAKAREVERQ